MIPEADRPEHLKDTLGEYTPIDRSKLPISITTGSDSTAVYIALGVAIVAIIIAVVAIMKKKKA